MTQKSAKSVIFYLLGIKNYSTYELRKKLSLRRFSKEEIERALAECQELGYLNDEEEATRRALRLKDRGYGPYWIREKMKRAGLPQPPMTKEEQGAAIRTVLKKASFAKKDRQKKIAALQRRGFDLECIHNQIENWEYAKESPRI